VDTQTIFNAAFMLATAVGGWFAREVWGAMKELRRDLHVIEVNLPSNYIRKDEFTEALRDLKKEISDGFIRLHERMDGKADK